MGRTLILGTGRCGTKYVTKVLAAVGVDIGHEVDGADGMSSWYAIGNSPPAFRNKSRGNERRPDTFVGEFKTVFHQVRHPLKVIPSIAKIFHSDDWKFAGKKLGRNMLALPPLARAACFWLEWNEAIEDLQPEQRYQVERIEDQWPYFQKHFGITKPFPSEVNKRTNASTGYRKAEEIGWPDLMRIDGLLASRIMKKAESYGYADQT